MSDRTGESDEAKPEDQEPEEQDPWTGPEPADAVDETDASPASVGPASPADDTDDSSTGSAETARTDDRPEASESSEGAAAARPAGVAAAVEPPSPDVTLADEASPLPGVHRGGFLRLPTAPVGLTTETAPAEPGTADAQEPIAEWLVPESAAPRRGLAGWALAFSIGGLVVSQFVGWGFPIGLVGVVSAILALRRPLESRAVAVWALVLGSVSVLYSVGWLLYAASRANLFG